MIYLWATSIIWAFSFGLIKTQLVEVNPYLTAFIRLLLSWLVFLPLLRKTPSSLALKLAGIGALQFGLMYCLYIYSYQFLQAHQVALLTITTPLFIVMIDAFWRRGWVSRYWLAAGLAIAAALVLVVDRAALTPSIKGLLLLQGANLCFALGQLLYKRVTAGVAQHHGHFAWLYLGALATPLFFLAAGPWDSLFSPLDRDAWLALLYLGLIPSGLGFYLWNKGVTLTDNGTVAAMNNLKIPLGALLAWMVFGEAIAWGRFTLSIVLFVLAVVLTGTWRFTTQKSTVPAGRK